MSALTPRPGILDIEPYVGGESRVSGIAEPIKLSSNESALGPSPRAVAAYHDAARRLHRYPDGACTALRAALGRHHGLDPGRIVCGNGSDDLLLLLARAYSGPGDEVLYSRHGFLIYPIAAQGAGAAPVAAPERDLKADVDALLAHATAKTRIVFLASPNNPTGSYLSAAELRRLRDGLRDDILLVIDAAYAEFADPDDYTPGIELVDAGDNVVMTRTFSKIYALSALRLGWAYCPPPVADILNRTRGPFNVNAAAQAAGLAALEDVDFTAAARAHNRRWRPWLAERLGGLGLHVYPSAANFLLVRFPDDPAKNADAADRFLKGRGIILRRVDKYGLSGCLRVTVGLEDEMHALVEALAEFMEGRR